VCRLGTVYPVLVRDPASDVEGIVVSGLTTRDAALLRAYEGPAYEVHQLTVRLSAGRHIRAQIFVAGTACRASSVPWTFEDWQGRFRSSFLRHVLRRYADRGR
jgi:hypothetical protein